MTERAIFRDRRSGRAWTGIAWMAVLAALWLGLASRVHVNASWSDGAWGYLALPIFGEPGIGDVVLFDPPDALGARVPWLKTVRGLPGMRVTVDADGSVAVDGTVLGRAKARALDGRPLEAITPATVPPGHVFLHGEHPDSHDSRYAEIGFVPRARIRALGLPLPDLPWLGLDGPLAGPEQAGTVSKSVPLLPLGAVR